MKKVLAILLTVVLGFSVTACGKTEPEVAASAPSAETGVPEIKALSELSIGFSIHFKTDDYGAIATQGFEETCAKAGVNSIILDANNDAQKQLADIESLIIQKVDVIIVSPLDEKAITDVCNKAVTAGIPVIPITKMPDVRALCTIETGNYEFSKEVAEKLAEEMNYEGEVAIITAAVSLWRIDQRTQAFEDVIASYPNMTLVATEKKMSPDEAMAAAEALIAANPDLKGIWGTFSNLVYGPGNAVKTLNKTDIVIGGVDADTPILKLMEEDWVRYVAAQDPYSHGQLSVEIAIDYLQGKEVPEEVIAVYKIYSASEAALASEEIWKKPLQ